MRFFYKTRGAVSIFLIIILLPMMTISGIFLDVSRAKMVQEVVTSSADLALNTTLSSYDSDLKDYFGLLASSQDASEAIELSKQYFAESMISAGVETSEAGIYADQIMDAFVGDTDISDMLRLSVEGDVDIKPTKNGALSNPAILKKEIVDFMKYRAPVNGIEKIFDALKKEDVAAKVENISKEMELVEAKKKFFEAEEKLLEQAEETYEAIKKYLDFTTSATGDKITNENFLHSFSTFLASPDGSGKTFEQIYKEAHKKMVMDLHNTHDTGGTLTVSLMSKQGIPHQGAVNTYSDSNRAGAGTIQHLLNDFSNKIVDYYNKKEALDSAWNSVGAMQSGDYGIQYWVILSNGCRNQYASYVNAAGELWKSANKLENAVMYPAEEAMDELMPKPSNSRVSFATPNKQNKLSLQSVCDSLMSKYNSSLKSEATGSGSSSYRSINSQLGMVDTSANRNKLQLSNVSDIYNHSNKLVKYYNDFQKAEGLATTAKNETKELKNLLKKYKTAFDKWKKLANDAELSDSDLVKDDKKEIAKLEEVGIEKFSENSIDELATRLGNIATVCKSFKKDIKNIKYKNTSVVNIRNYNSFRTAASIDNGRIVRQQNALEQYAEESFSFTIGTQIQRIEIYDGIRNTPFDDGDAYVITDNYHTNLEKTRLELYEWLKYEFGTQRTGTPLNKEKYGYDVTNKSSAKNAKKDIKKTSENPDDVSTTESTTGKSFSQWSGATLPSKGVNAVQPKTVTAKIQDVGNFVSDIFGDFSGTFMKSLKNMRDDLYVEDYIFEMFTHDTFDKEGCYDLLENKSGLKLSNVEAKYKDVKGNWKDSLENKTLTLTPRDTANNWAYGGEVEYILYGNKNNAKNKTTAYASIYMIRYAFDVSAVFQAYYDDDPIIETIALSLELFAHIPAKLTKTLICLAITAAEAGMDIKYLKAGLPVVLIKGEDDLLCDYETVFTGADEKETALDNRVALQYSDYLKIFMFIALQGYNENYIYIRTADVIQANMALSTGDSKFELAKSQVYYDFKANVIMEPMWSRLLAVDNLGDLSTSKGWRTMTIEMTRGY